MSLYMFGTHHIFIYYLYNIALWGSKSVVLTISQLYYIDGFLVDKFDLQSLCHSIKVVELKM